MRWRVARAALELGALSTSAEHGVVFDRWSHDGRSLPELESPAPLHLNETSCTVLPPGFVVLRALRERKAVYLAPVLESGWLTKFVACVSEGSVLSMGPYHSSSLSVSFYLCSSITDDAHSLSPTCEELHPPSLKLIPEPSPEKPFPVPHEGVDESEGAVVFEAILPGRNGCEHRWVAISYSNNEDRRRIFGDFVEDEPTVRQFNVHGTYSTICYYSSVDEFA